MSGGPVVDSLTGETVGVTTNAVLGKGAGYIRASTIVHKRAGTSAHTLQGVLTWL